MSKPVVEVHIGIKRVSEEIDVCVDGVSVLDQGDPAQEKVFQFRRSLRERIDELVLEHFGVKSRDCNCSGGS